MRSTSLLFDLGKLLEAGIAPAEALGRLADGAHDKRGLASLATDFRRGLPLAAALYKAGFATRLETAILKTADDAGKLGEGLDYVATNFERRQHRAAALRVRLWLPNAVAFLALAIGVVRAVAAGAAISTTLFNAFVVALVLVALTYILLTLAAKDATQWLSFGWRLGLQRSSDLYRQFFEQTFYTLFVWQVEAGRDYQSAANSLTSLLEAPTYRRAVSRYRQAVAGGGAVVDALERAQLLTPGELAQVINVGEQSGRLGAALGHYLLQQGVRLEQWTERVFTWLPRIYYVFVVMVAVVAMF